MANNLFYGIELATPVQDRLTGLIDSIKSAVPRATWTPPNKLHLTLHFIGKSNEDRDEDALNNLENIQHDPFDITIKGTGQFDAGRVLWAKVEPKEEYGAFSPFDILRAQLSIRGPFTGHVTLGKLERRADRCDEFLDFSRTLKEYDFGVSKVTSVKLYRTMGGDSPYETLGWKAL